jgi:Zn-finger nucleic acid-binding protein
MVEESFSAVTVDRCTCGSLWLDWGELDKIDGSTSTVISELALLPKYTTGLRDARIPCPRCGTPMHEHRYKKVPRVLIDECYLCRGFFLDPGELAAVQQDLSARRDKSRNAQALLAQVPEYQKARFESDLARDRADALDKFCKRIMTKILWFPSL